MPKFIIGLLAAIALTAVGAGPASAQAPLDSTGQLSGYIPPTQGSLSCTRYMNKRSTVMPLKCSMACAIDFATTASRGLSFDLDYCENTWPQFSCLNRYQEALTKLDQGTCMNCLDAQAREDLYPAYHSVTDTAKDQIFCDNNPANTPFPDGHGFVSQQRDVVKCQVKVMRNLMKAAKCLNLKCHVKTAEALFWGKPIRTTNAQCEDQDVIKSCKAHFDSANSKLVGCPPCVDMAAVWNSFQDGVDLNNGLIYCSDAP
jgi:hypothetical protein